MMNRRLLERRKVDSVSKDPPKEEAHQYSLFKKLLTYPLYAIIPIILIHFYFDPFSLSSPTITTKNTRFTDGIPDVQIPSPNTITTSSPPPPTNSQESSNNNVTRTTSCDYSKGEWIPHNEEPLYNGTTCTTIIKGQDCIAHGRPDKQYLYWKWQPENCILPKFDPQTFLKLLENKHIAFAGDSLARNQLESLLCMTATAVKPILTYSDGEPKKFRKWTIPSHNINISNYWSPFLVKGIERSEEVIYNTLFLDSVNEKWAADLAGIDVLILTAGHWFLTPTFYYYNDTLIGCHNLENCTEIGFYDVYGKALTTAFNTIMDRKREREMNVFLMAFMPAHFVGKWDDIGACNKTMPFREGEQILEGTNKDMRRVGVEMVEETKIRAREFGDVKVRFEVLDVTKMALMRPDGHPGPYMKPFPFANGVGESVWNDCVHWCLPGAMDTVNEVLLELMKRWEGYDF